MLQTRKLSVILMASVLLFASACNRKEEAPGASESDTVLKVGYLPVTCHLTCPVTDFATKKNPGMQFKSQRFMDWPSVGEAFKAKRLHATFLVAPMAMKLQEQGVGSKIVYLGHRDGSTIIVRKSDPARSIADLKGKVFAVPSRFSNQFLVLHKLMKDLGMKASELRIVEVPPPEMPTALVAGKIDAYFTGEPYAAKAEMDGTGRVLHHAKDIWPHFISCVLVVSDELIRDHPDQVRKLVQSIAESGQWAEEHRLEAAKVAAPYFRQDEKLVRYVLTQPKDRVSYTGLTPTDLEMEKIRDMALEAGLITKALPIRQIIDRQFIPKEIKVDSQRFTQAE